MYIPSPIDAMPYNPHQPSNSGGFQQQHQQQPHQLYRPPYQQQQQRDGGYRGGGGGNSYSGERRGGGVPHRFNPDAQPYRHEERSYEELFKDHCPGINFEKHADTIHVSIRPPIAPMNSFVEMQFNRALYENILHCKYVNPTPVQKYGIPAVLSGRDLMACAQTGSGKTAAYLLPAIHNALALGRRNLGPQQRTVFPIMLVLAPTRELSIQIHEEARKFSYATPIRSVVVYGGADAHTQLYHLQNGCDVLVATPGRLWEFFGKGVIRFADIKYLVLDEGDRMLDMGFEPQIRTIVESYDSDMPGCNVRQTMLYSATFPTEIQHLARDFLKPNYSFLQVGRVGSTTDDIIQSIEWVEEMSKNERLYQIIAQRVDQLVLVFVERKRDVNRVERFLKSCGIYCAAIHGDRTQREREGALMSFRAGYVKVMVATDVAARGLDIVDVAAVVQYDLPSNIDDYVHRIGRTGRAGRQGEAIAFFNEKNVNIVSELIALLKENRMQVPEFLYTVRARKHQLPSDGFSSRFRGGGGGGFRRGGRGGGFHDANNGGNPFGGWGRGGGQPQFAFGIAQQPPPMPQQQPVYPQHFTTVQVGAQQPPALYRPPIHRPQTASSPYYAVPAAGAYGNINQ